MEISLIKAFDYNKIDKILQEYIEDDNEREKLIISLQNIETRRRAEIVSSAGRLSRFPGDVLEVLNLSEGKTLEQNTNYASRVIGMVHESISDHDYCVFAMKDVSPLVEQTIIAERFSSFTIKSRREVDFSNVGFYIPNFHNKEGEIHPDNKSIQQEYKKYMQSLFDSYEKLVNQGIPVEDARFVLPYCYHSNIIMGIDAHTLKDMIIKFTKTKYQNIEELRELGEKLYQIAKQEVPYIIPIIDATPSKQSDDVEEYLNNNISKEKYQIIEQPKLLSYSQEVDASILISAIMRRYKYDYDQAKKVYDKLSENPNFQYELMKKIAFSSDKLELTQANFRFQIPLSYAILTHLTRHRTHDIIVPDFVPNPDLMQYKTPPTIKKEHEDEYNNIFYQNQAMYEHFKNDYGIREEDLVYFTLSGNLINVITNMNGKTLEHILRLRECNKAQWETRQMAYGMHKEIKALDDAKIFEQILGSTCITQGICNEGKECCGKVYTLKNKK